jgi:hypothetical protein
VLTSGGMNELIRIKSQVCSTKSRTLATTQQLLQHASLLKTHRVVAIDLECLAENDRCYKGLDHVYLITLRLYLPKCAAYIFKLTQEIKTERSRSSRSGWEALPPRPCITRMQLVTGRRVTLEESSDLFMEKDGEPTPYPSPMVPCRRSITCRWLSLPCVLCMWSWPGF